MEQIEKAYRYAAAKSRRWNITWFFCGVFTFLMGLLQAIQEKDFIQLTVSAALLIITLASCVFVVARSKAKEGFMHSRAYKSLVELGYEDEFFNTIDSEMQYKLKIHYTEDIDRISLFVTDTWLIFISINNSVIRKVSDVSRVREVFLPAERAKNRFILSIEFLDGKYLNDACGWYARAEIVELFAKEFPFMVQQDVK